MNSSESLNLNENIRWLKLMVNVTHGIFLSSIFVFIFIIILLPKFGFTPVYKTGDVAFCLIELTLTGISLIIFGINVFWPRIARWNRKYKMKYENILWSHFCIRLPLFESINIFALILSLLGSSWYIFVTIFFLSLVSLIFNYPTDRRLAIWIGLK